MQAAPGIARSQGLRRRGRVRAPPPPLRVQQRVPRVARRGGDGVQGGVAARAPARDRRTGPPPPVACDPRSPRVPLPPQPPPPPLPRLLSSPLPHPYPT